MPQDAFASGLMAAASLVIGAILGLRLRPSHTAVAAIMAFGSGTLISAIAFELIEPAFERAGLVPLTLGFLGGAGAFSAINAALDGSGGFLRKASTAEGYLRQRKRAAVDSAVTVLSRVDLFRSLPPGEMQALAPAVRSASLPAGQVLFTAGDEGDSLYVVGTGELEVLRGSERIATLGPGEVAGEMALVTGEPRSATVRVTTDAELYRIAKPDFDRLVSSSPPVALQLSRLLARRLGATSVRHAEAEAEARRWRDDALRSVEGTALRASPVEHRAVLSEHGGSAAVGIYVGLFLDAIPESLAVGALTIGAASFNVPFLFALFISDLPEAMSSSVIMRRIGYSARRVLLMWGGLMLFTGIGAVVGNLAFAGASPFALAVIFAAAAGAMLAMLAQTAMPEAYEQGGWVVGIATVLGFLAAYAVRKLGE